MAAWQLQIPVEVEVYTTRGGRWPERRVLPEGGPGASWAAQVQAIVERLDNADGAGADGAAWMARPSTDGAAEAVAMLLGTDV